MKARQPYRNKGTIEKKYRELNFLETANINDYIIMEERKKSKAALSIQVLLLEALQDASFIPKEKIVNERR